MGLTEEEKEIYERMKVDVGSVAVGDKVRVMLKLTPDEVKDFYKTQLTIEEKALYLRARDHPMSITPAEKNEIFARMDPDEEDRLCRERTGVPFNELQAKAWEDEDSLTEVEAAILAYGADCDPDNRKRVRNRRFLTMDLDSEEQALVHEVWHLFDANYESTVERKARSRLEDLYKRETWQQKVAWRNRMRQKRYPTKLAKWVQDILDANTPRCGFIIFRTDYSDGSDEKWEAFLFHELRAKSVHFTDHWRRANNLHYRFNQEYISDSSLEGLDVKALRSRFISMRERGEIPEGIASTCFLVADEAVLNHAVIEGRIYFSAKTADHPDPWYDTLSIRAINADYDGPDGGGEIVLPIPKICEWLYFYTTFTTDTAWETLEETAQVGPAEILEPFAPLPLWQNKGKEVLRFNTLQNK